MALYKFTYLLTYLLLIRPATLSRFRDFAAAYKSADLLTYLL